MAEKNIKSRIIHKHDIEANWLKAVNFIPKQGELIIYDVDDMYPYSRMKIGDGISNVNSLPFANQNFENVQVTAVILEAADGRKFRLTVDIDGSLDTEEVEG